MELSSTEWLIVGAVVGIPVLYWLFTGQNKQAIADKKHWESKEKK